MSFLTINDAAQMLNVSPDTIRRWGKKGLVRSSRSELNYRTFDLNELNALQQKYSGDSVNAGFRVLEAGSTPYNVIELFSGAGGLALGLENAGMRAEMLVEYDKNAAATLRTNRPNWNVVHADVHDVDFLPYRDKVDIVAGGFPCQAFSYAGRGQGFEDTRGTLFFEFARCVSEVRPKIALGENVRGLLRHDEGRTLKTMIAALDELGYRTSYALLRAQFLDVPQKRERLVILGVRKDLDLPFLFPKERNYTVSMREALEGCPISEGMKYTQKKKEIMDLVPPGGCWRDLPLEIQKAYMMGSFHLEGGKTGMARRLSWDEPSLTLTCNPAQKQTERCHPEDTRPLTCREYARIQTFPDTWQFTGSTGAQYKQIGNAVPCNLGFHVGQCLVHMLSGKAPDDDTMITGALVAPQNEPQLSLELSA